LNLARVYYRVLLAALLCRHLLQRYAATYDLAVQGYPATRFAEIPSACD
jgi:hypothetical protein